MNFLDPSCMFLVAIIVICGMFAFFTAIVSLFYGLFADQLKTPIRILWTLGHLVLIMALCHYAVWIRYVNTH